MKTGVVVLTFLVLLILAGVLNWNTVEAQTGTPSIQTTYYISDSDQRVYVNDTFTVRFSMRRTSGGAGNGGISVSFPGLDQADTDSRASAYDSPKASVVTDSYTNGVNKVSYFASGYSPIHTAGGTQRAAEYLLVESDDTSWPLNTYRTLELEVTPKTTGLLVINYRYWLCGDGYQNCTYSPTSGSVDDQQGWHVDSFRVLVRNRAPTATRVSPSSRDVELEPGSSQTFTARGRDRDGNLAQVEWYLDDDEWSGGLSLVPTGSYTHSNTFSFPDVGTYRVQVEFTDTIGESDSTYWDVEVGIRVTVASNPSGRTIRVNRTNRTAPYATTWVPGSRLALDVPSPQNVSGVNDRYVFSHWSHGGSQRQTVRPTTSTTYTANFTLQHFLSTRTEPRGVGVPGGGQWYDHGSTARVGPAPILTGLQFSHWEKGDGQRIGSDPAGVRVTVDTAFLVQAVYTPASAQSPQIDSLGCAPTTVQVGETVSCLPELSGGTPTEYDWDAIGGSPPSGTARNFSTRWNTSGAKRVDLEACNASGCDSQSQTMVVGSGGRACFTNWGTLPMGNTSVSGSWDGSCASTSRSGRYGRFYAFTLNQRSRVRIDLSSSADTYLYLLRGADSEGTALASNDDGSGANSRLDLTLDAGTYTVEATTFSPNTTGSFSLTINLAEALVFTLTAVPQPDLNELAELQSELERQEVELNQGNPSPPIEIPLLEMLRQVDHNAIFVVEPDAQDSDYDARFNLAVSGAGNDVTVTITASAQQDITILDSDGLNNANQVGDFAVEGSLSIKTTDGGLRAFEIEGQCQAEGGFAFIRVADENLQTVDVGAILCEPADACTQPLPRFSALPERDPIHGEWISGCHSQHRPGRFARHYTFTLAADPSGSPTNLTVRLRSSVDTYLYLLESAGPAGRIIAENNDGPSYLGTDSQIEAALGPGTYTVEATTNERALIGAFTLTVSGFVISQGAPDFDGPGCSPTTVEVDEVVECIPRLTGGVPDSYFWTALGGVLDFGTGETFSTQFHSSGAKVITFEACNNQGCYQAEQAITVTGRPMPPQALRITSLVAELITAEQSHDGMAHVLLTWDPPGTVAGTATWRTEADVGDDNLSKSMVYVIQRLDVNNPGDGWTTLESAWPHQYPLHVSAAEVIDTVRTQEYRDEPDAGSYTYRVASQWDNRSQSVWVETGIVRTVAEDISLSPPSNVRVNPVGSGIALVGWGSVAGAVGYALIATNLSDPSGETRTAAAASDATSGLILGLTVGDEYLIFVGAFNDQLEFELSEYVRITAE